MVVLPEKWNAIGNPEVLHGAAETLEDGESVQAMAAWASRHGITLVGGSITERREGRDKLSNTSIVFDSDGSIVGLYRKIHMFDVEVGGHVYRESDAEEPGDEPVVLDVEGWPTGLTVCYDVRFPELYRILALGGAPRHGSGAFHALHRQDLGAAAPRPCRREPVLRRGRGPDRRDAARPPQLRPSPIADPWGTVVALAPDEETVISAELDRRRLEARAREAPVAGLAAGRRLPLANSNSVAA